MCLTLFLIVTAASIVAYVQLPELEARTSIDKSMARSQWDFPTGDRLNKKRSLIGVVTVGPHANNYIRIRWTSNSDFTKAEYEIVSKHRPVMGGITSDEDLDPFDLEQSLKKLGVAYLPQSKYSDEVERAYFAKSLAK